MNNPSKAIFWGGFWCGVLDFASAWSAWGIARGVGPVRIGQSIAGGLLGSAAFQGGWLIAVLGVLLHFVIAFGAATVYWLASRKLRFLIEHPIPCGLVYGELVFLFMNMVVLPLSALHTDPLRWTSFSPWPTLVTGPIGHPILVGLPIALAISKWSEPRAARASSAGAAN